MATCAKGHPLLWATPDDLIRNSAGYRNGYSCDVCRVTKSGGCYHCNHCRYDMCPSCHRPYEQVQEEKTSHTTPSETQTSQTSRKKVRTEETKDDQVCTANHKLKSFEIPNTGPDPIRCHLCLREYNIGESFRGCEACELDVCKKCFTLANFNANAKPLLCKGSHRLLQVKTTSSGWSCDICLLGMAEGAPTFYCKECNWCACETCYEDNTPLYVTRKNFNCKENHGLKRYPTPKNNYGCDICKSRFGPNTIMYGCRVCNFDVCVACFES